MLCDYGGMPSRREEILDAAIRVLGAQGPRGLTHRAVDKAAGLPLGSTANLFSRRDDLMGALVDHMEEADRSQWAKTPRSADLSEMLTELVFRSAQEPMRTVQTARYHLQFARPEETAAANRRLSEELAALLATAGIPAEEAELLSPVLDGFMLRAVTYGAESLPAYDEVAKCLKTLMTGANP